MMDQAKARLRKTFKYPSDEGSSSASRDEMDEEEQEALLSTLSSTATQHDSTYRLIFTALPLLSTLPFLYQLLAHPNRSTALPTLLSTTSLAITAWSMWTVQADDAVMGKAGTRPSVIFAQPGAPQLRSEGPLIKYLPYLNILIAVILLCASYLFFARAHVSEGFWLLLLLPAVMLGVVAVVKAGMLEIRSGLGELRGLKYEYKGA